jgi:hypothetical protein
VIRRPLTLLYFCAVFLGASAIDGRDAGAAVVAGDAGGHLDLEGSFAMVAPSSSPYRDDATALGYDRRTARYVYEGEVTALFRPDWFGLGDALRIGPLLRASFDRLGAPYDGVSPLDVAALVVGGRAELRLSSFPVVFGWGDVAAGASSAGPAGAHATSYVLGARVGVGLRIGVAAEALRVRLGYAYQPTGRISDRGGLDLGGFVVALDGVIRALD